MLLTVARVANYLRKNGIDVGRLRSDPELASKVVNGLYRSIPIPLRWVVRKKRVRRLVLAAQSYVSRELGAAGGAEEPGPG